jgi:hypothetical protein
MDKEMVNIQIKGTHMSHMLYFPLSNYTILFLHAQRLHCDQPVMTRIHI